MESIKNKVQNFKDPQGDKGVKGVESEGKQAFQNYKKDEAGPQANHAQFGKDEMAAFKGSTDRPQ